MPVKARPLHSGSPCLRTSASQAPLPTNDQSRDDTPEPQAAACIASKSCLHAANALRTIKAPPGLPTAAR